MMQETPNWYSVTTYRYGMRREERRGSREGDIYIYIYTHTYG